MLNARLLQGVPYMFVIYLCQEELCDEQDFNYR